MFCNVISCTGYSIPYQGFGTSSPFSKSIRSQESKHIDVFLMSDWLCQKGGCAKSPVRDSNSSIQAINGPSYPAVNGLSLVLSGPSLVLSGLSYLQSQVLSGPSYLLSQVLDGPFYPPSLVHHDLFYLATDGPSLVLCDPSYPLSLVLYGMSYSATDALSLVCNVYSGNVQAVDDLFCPPINSLSQVLNDTLVYNSVHSLSLVYNTYSSSHQTINDLCLSLGLYHLSFIINNLKHSCIFMLELSIRILFNVLKLMLTIIWRQDYIRRKSIRINLFLKRNLYRRHDFICYIQKLPDSSTVQEANQLFYILIFYYLYTFQNLTKLFNKHVSKKWIYYSVDLVPSIISSYDNTTYNIIGGGSNMFSFEELQEYIPQSENINHKSGFKFKAYILKSECDESQYQDNMACVSEIPLNSLLSKLTVAELRTIATCHCIRVFAKAKSTDIQTAINNHMCIDCSQYICIFEVIDGKEHLEHKRALNLKAVNKYRATKDTEEIRLTNLKSVKKNHKKKGDNYKSAHLKSVKKNQKKQEDKYKVSNRKAAYKYWIKKKSATFPPPVPTLELQHEILSNACKDMSSCKLIECGCAVCGQLTPVFKMLEISDTELDFDILSKSSITQQE